MIHEYRFSSEGDKKLITEHNCSKVEILAIKNTLRDLTAKIYSEGVLSKENIQQDFFDNPDFMSKGMKHTITVEEIELGKIHIGVPNDIKLCNLVYFLYILEKEEK